MRIIIALRRLARSEKNFRKTADRLCAHLTDLIAEVNGKMA